MGSIHKNQPANPLFLLVGGDSGQYTAAGGAEASAPASELWLVVSPGSSSPGTSLYGDPRTQPGICGFGLWAPIAADRGIHQPLRGHRVTTCPGSDDLSGFGSGCSK